MTSCSEIDSNLDNLVASAGSMNGRLSAIESKVDTILNKLNSLDNLDSRLSAIESRLSTIENKIDNLLSLNSNLLDTILAAIQSGNDALVDLILGAIQSANDALVDLILGAINALKELLLGIFGNKNNDTDKIIQEIINTRNKLIEKMREGTRIIELTVLISKRDILAAIERNKQEDCCDKIIAQINQLETHLNSIKGLIQSSEKNIIREVDVNENKIDRVLDSFRGLEDKIRDSERTIIREVDVNENKIDRVLNDIKGFADKIKDAERNIIREVDINENKIDLILLRLVTINSELAKISFIISLLNTIIGLTNLLLNLFRKKVDLDPILRKLNELELLIRNIKCEADLDKVINYINETKIYLAQKITVVDVKVANVYDITKIINSTTNNIDNTTKTINSTTNSIKNITNTIDNTTKIINSTTTNIDTRTINVDGKTTNIYNTTVDMSKIIYQTNVTVNNIEYKISYAFTTVNNIPPAIKQAEATIIRAISTPTPIPTPIQIKVLSGVCELEEGVWKYKPQLIDIMVAPEDISKTLQEFQELYKVNNELCELKNKECIALVPEWWQVRIEGCTPQFIVAIGEVDSATGRILHSKYAISIPHFQNVKPLQSPVPRFKKGNFLLIGTFPDNSKLIINAFNESEAMKVYSAIYPYLNPDMARGIKLNLSERRGHDFKEIWVGARTGKYFSTGNRNFNPDWIVYF